MDAVKLVQRALPSRELLLPTLIVVASWLVYNYWDGHAFGTRRRTDLKGPRGWPLLGNSLLLLTDVNERMYEQFALCVKRGHAEEAERLPSEGASRPPTTREV